MEEIVRRADVIAKTEPLTEETLLKEIFGFQENTFRLRKKKKYVLKQVKSIIRKYTRSTSYFVFDKQCIIYCIIRLYNEKVIYGYNFKWAWEVYLSRIVLQYKYWYVENKINEIQRAFIVV